MKILAYTSNGEGHLFPLVAGLLSLRDRGHQVHLRCQARHLAPVRAAGLEAEPVDAEITAIEVTDYLAKSGRERLHRGLGDLMRRGTLERPDLATAIEEVGPDLVIVDSLGFGAMTAAEAWGLPWAAFAGGLLPARGEGIPPFGLGLAPMPGPLGHLRDAVLWRVSERIYGNALMPGLNRLRAEGGLEPLRRPFEFFLLPDRLLVGTDQPLEYPRSDLPPNIELVGPQFWEPPVAPPVWLEEPGDPWILITCSTDYQGDESLWETAVEALRGRPFRLLVTTGEGRDGEPPRPPDGVRFERFVPHGPVLAKAAGVICHGGMGIVQRSVLAGVPLVVVPFGRDQPEVARRVARAGAGVSLPAKSLGSPRLLAAFEESQTIGPSVTAAGRALRARTGRERFAMAIERAGVA